MTTFAPIALPHIAPPDPSKHVNYQLGMVLGVDDFQAEFTYLSDRMRRIVRDLIGYGVVSGLHVTIGTEIDERGPRLQVSPGGLVTPSGQLVCISPAQCSYLNEWLKANRSAIPDPVLSELELSVVACYRECQTDDVPIPGEPCRSEDELMKPSRTQDFFALELHLDAPPQAEDDAVRKFVAWVRRIAIVEPDAGDTAPFLAELGKATQGAASDPPLAFLDTAPPATLKIPRAAAAAYLDLLFDFWVTRLRSRARSGANIAECGCCGGPGDLDPGAECLRIATVTVPIKTGLGGDLLVDDPAKIVIDEQVRPHLLHLRMLQEWVLQEWVPDVAPVPVPAPGAYGEVRPDGVTVPVPIVNGKGGLEAIQIDPTLFLVTYKGFNAKVPQLVTGQPLSFIKEKPSLLEVIARDDSERQTALDGLPSQPPPEGVVVRVMTVGGDAVKLGFTIAIEPVEGTS
jgi:hypothetical protein